LPGGGQPLNILVTGATGFTGRHLTRRLVEDGARVVAFVRPESGTVPLTSLGVETRVVNLANSSDVARSFEPFDRVFHLAAAFRTEFADEEEFWRVNVEGTRNLLDSAGEKGVGRFVHCSTVGVQGEIRDPPADEEYRYRPGDHYQESKLEGERLALQAASEGLSVAVVRPAGIYGPGDTRFLKLFRSIAKGRFAMIGSGRTLYHFTYVEDLVRGFLLAGDHPDAEGEVFTIGGERATTLNDLVAIIAEVVGVSPPRLKIPYAPVYWGSFLVERIWKAFGAEPPLYPRRAEFFALDRAFDISKAREVLGYQPRVSLEEGLKQTAEWYREEGLL
jgi:nucleoside-diphosphate-sugar epimerase